MASIPTINSSPTQLLLAWSRGDTKALNRLLPLVYSDLRRLARRSMRSERAGHTLQPTALVNEVFLRLVDVRGVMWQNRAHFLAVAARAMRRILVDVARERRADKRGGQFAKVALDENLLPTTHPAHDVEALDEALAALEQVHPRKSRVVELRYFGGLSVEETAAALDVSIDTVKRDWRFAKLWLLRQLRGDRT